MSRVSIREVKSEPACPGLLTECEQKVQAHCICFSQRATERGAFGWQTPDSRAAAGVAGQAGEAAWTLCDSTGGTAWGSLSPVAQGAPPGRATQALPTSRVSLPPWVALLLN